MKYMYDDVMQLHFSGLNKQADFSCACGVVRLCSLHFPAPLSDREYLWLFDFMDMNT